MNEDRNKEDRLKEDRDNRLQALFAEARQDLDDTAFTEGMLTHTRFQRYRGYILLSFIALVAMLCAYLFSSSLLDFVLQMTEILTAPLINMGEGWLSWILLPINNIASLLVLSGRVLYSGWKFVARASYTN